MPCVASTCSTRTLTPSAWKDCIYICSNSLIFGFEIVHSKPRKEEREAKSHGTTNRLPWWDRSRSARAGSATVNVDDVRVRLRPGALSSLRTEKKVHSRCCLLYTSDAAAE